ncbi:MAG: amidohydrolase [Flavobacteriaceae bacterium]|nr:amidohydrolase [Flavobacteriaceae bacterium]
MQEELKITIIQSDLVWENPSANLKLFSEKIESISEKTDLIVLPEMFATGFTMNAQTLAEDESGASVSWMISEAKKYNTAITGSLIISEKGLFYNRLFFVFPDGSYKVYNKRHTFTLAGEHNTFARGNEQIILNYKGWKICPLVCYDLRFPVWARNTMNYDILLYVANWPERRISAWDALLKARAIENMTYCIGVNRTGLDGNEHQYVGHSAVYDVLGEQISTKDFEQEFIETITLYKTEIETKRNHLQFLNDKDSFTLT